MKAQTRLSQIKKMDINEAEQTLIQQFEHTYDLPDIGFTAPDKPMIDPFLKDKIKKIYAKMRDKKDGGMECDWWIAIIGPEGIGKSTFAGGMLYEYCLNANMDFANLLKEYVAFDEFDMVRMISRVDPKNMFNFIWADEGANVFFNRDSATIARRWAMKFANAMRFLRYFVVVCSVELKQLDTIVRDHRIKSLIRIQEQGIYHYYNHDQMIRLMQVNGKARDSNFNWRAVEPEHVGYFYHSPQIKQLVDALKYNYLVRFQMEAKQEYTYMLRKKLFKLENTKDKDKTRWKWT